MVVTFYIKLFRTGADKHNTIFDVSPPSSRRDKNYNHVHNTLRLFDGLADFPFTASEKKRDYE